MFMFHIAIYKSYIPFLRYIYSELSMRSPTLHYNNFFFAKQLCSLSKKSLRMPLATLQNSLLWNIYFCKTRLDR